MKTQANDQAADRHEALLWAVAGAAWIGNAVLGLDAADKSSGFYITEIVWVGVHVLVLVGLLGLWRVQVVGERPWARRALALAIAGRAWFAVCELAAIAIGHDELPIFPIAVVSTGLGMTFAGIAAMRAHRWRGWRPATLAAMGAYPLLIIVPTFAITGERPPNAVIAGWGLTLFGIAAAWATRSSASATGVTTATAAPQMRVP
jgi:hypothetical protein